MTFPWIRDSAPVHWSFSLTFSLTFTDSTMQQTTQQPCKVKLKGFTVKILTLLVLHALHMCLYVCCNVAQINRRAESAETLLSSGRNELLLWLNCAASCYIQKFHCNTRYKSALCDRWGKWAHGWRHLFSVCLCTSSLCILNLIFRIVLHNKKGTVSAVLRHICLLVIIVKRCFINV